MLLPRSFLRYLYWFVALALVLPWFIRINLKLYKAFLASSLAFTLDTLYLNWNTTFPAATVCEIYNGEKNWDISENYFGVGRDHRIDDYVADITFFSGKCHTCSYCEDIACPTNFDELIGNVCNYVIKSTMQINLENSVLRLFDADEKINFRTECEQLITNCSWIGEPFDCCTEFRPIDTEYGLCYSFNSMQTESYRELNFINNRESGPGSLHFMLSEDTQIHVHPPNDIPYIMSEGVIRETVLWGSSKEIVFNVVEIVNDPGVMNFSPDHRKCRFYHEIENKENQLYRFYSYSTCIVECMKQAHLRLCECTSHFMPHGDNESYYSVCGIEGLKCLSDQYELLIEMRKNCECLSSCEEPEYNVIYTSGESTSSDDTASLITISMISLPTQRYIRKVVKTNLDLIISVGGIAGLFFGASLLSIIEIFYNGLVYATKLKGIKSRPPEKKPHKK